jgi:hypothetical protein
MTVQNIVPYEKYVTSGSDSVYTVSYYVEDKDNLLIKLNDEVVSKNEYNYIKSSNAIQFNTTLLANQKLEIFRKTKLERATNFESYNNTLRPEVLNKDLDKIWLNLQEQSHKVDQYDLNYDYAVHTSTQALTEVKTAQIRADQAYTLADLTNTETRSIEYGGTGATTAKNARTNLNVHSKEEVVSLIQSGGTGTIVNVSGGGTGADNIADARTNLDVYSKEEINQRAMTFPTGFVRHVLLHRSKIEDGDLALDGQLVSRTDYPELWEVAQNSGLLITDTAWLSDPLKRIAYSSGDGETNFRLPDYNGIQDQSLKSPVLRGDGYSSTGTALSDAIRNITGFQGATRENYETPTGAFYKSSGGSAAGSGSQATTTWTMYFDASRVVPTANENRPVSAFGIYVVVAKGRTEKAPSSGNNPTLTGSNIWNGSQDVQGNLLVNGKITGDIRSSINAEGDAPISAIRSYVIGSATSAPTILRSMNVASVTKPASSQLTVNFIKPMTDTNYIVLAYAKYTAAPNEQIGGITTTKTVNSCTINFRVPGNQSDNAPEYTVVIL